MHGQQNITNLRVSRYQVVQGCALVLTPIRWMSSGITRCASVLTTERCTIYTTWHNNHMFGAMCHSRKFDPFPLWEAVTVACAVTQELILPHPLQTVQPNPSTASATHHCHSVRTLCYLYPKISCGDRTILRYSCFINTEIQLWHSMNIKNHQIIPLRPQEFEITIFIAVLTWHSTSSAF